MYKGEIRVKPKRSEVLKLNYTTLILFQHEIQMNCLPDCTLPLPHLPCFPHLPCSVFSFLSLSCFPGSLPVSLPFLSLLSLWGSWVDGWVLKLYTRALYLLSQCWITKPYPKMVFLSPPSLSYLFFLVLLSLFFLKYEI